MNLARSSLPGTAASAARNSGWALEQWFGTRSMMTLIWCAAAPETGAPKSAMVPSSGSTAQ